MLESSLRSRGRLVSRRLAASVILASLLGGAVACRGVDGERIVNTSTSVVRSVSESTAVKRIPGGRPDGRGDPRRYGGSAENRRTADSTGR
jgi:hypothetical protein